MFSYYILYIKFPKIITIVEKKIKIVQIVNETFKKKKISIMDRNTLII